MQPPSQAGTGQGDALRPDAGKAFRRGVVAVLPLLLGTIPFALLLGALAAQKGLSLVEVILMSGLVFAGTAQFLAVELWRDPAPLLLLGAMTLFVNARHFLMGAAFEPLLRGEPGRRIYPALFFMTDETWAMTLTSGRRGGAALAYFLGLSSSLYVNWVAWTAIGAGVGTTMGDPARYGFDFAFVAVFIVLLRGLWRGRRSLPPWLASAAVAAVVHLWLPGPWYVPAGAIAGLAIAALQADPVK